MGVDPFTMAAIGQAAGATANAYGQIGAAALSSPPSYSAAQSDSNQGGVYFAPASTWTSDFNVVGGGGRGGSLTTANGGFLSSSGSNPSGGVGTVGGNTTIGQLLPLIVIGGVAWLLLRKKKSG